MHFQAILSHYMAVAHTRQPNNRICLTFCCNMHFQSILNHYMAVAHTRPQRGGSWAEIQRPIHQGLVLVNGVFESSNMAWILYALCVSCMFCALCMSWLLVVRCLMGCTSAGPFSPLLIFSLLGSVTWHIPFLPYLLLGCPHTGWEMANWWLIPDQDVAV